MMKNVNENSEVLQRAKALHFKKRSNFERVNFERFLILSACLLALNGCKSEEGKNNIPRPGSESITSDVTKFKEIGSINIPSNLEILASENNEAAKKNVLFIAEMHSSPSVNLKVFNALEELALDPSISGTIPLLIENWPEGATNVREARRSIVNSNIIDEYKRYSLEMMELLNNLQAISNRDERIGIIKEIFAKGQQGASYLAYIAYPERFVPVGVVSSNEYGEFINAMVEFQGINAMYKNMDYGKCFGQNYTVGDVVREFNGMAQMTKEHLDCYCSFRNAFVEKREKLTLMRDVEAASQEARVAIKRAEQFVVIVSGSFHAAKIREVFEQNGEVNYIFAKPKGEEVFINGDLVPKHIIDNVQVPFMSEKDKEVCE